ncbi:MAG: hypothetical protein NVS3B19_19520 [Ginsengibacter sp.]
MEKLYLDDVDEAIILRKQEFDANNAKTLHIADIPVWNRFNRDTRIFPDTIHSQPKDSIIQETFLDALVPEWEPYRVLYTTVKIEQKPFVLMIRLNLVESEDLIKTLAWLYLYTFSIAGSYFLCHPLYLQPLVEALLRYAEKNRTVQYRTTHFTTIQYFCYKRV